MGTFPDDPGLPAVTTSTRVDPDFLNTLVDNINAIGVALGDLVNNVADGNFDIAVDKGIKWGGNLEIYFSGGNIIMDEGVLITGALDVAGTLTVDTIDDSGASFITVNEDMHFAAGKYIDVPTLKVDAIDDSGAASIAVSESMDFAAGKYIDVPTLKVDTIDDSGAADITVNETLVLAAGKYVKADIVYCDTILDYGAGFINIQENTKIYHASDARTLQVTTGGVVDVEIFSDRYISIAQHTGTPANRTSDGFSFWQDTSGNLKVKVREGSSTKTKTITPYAPAAYTVVNDLTDRNFDADTVAVAELADVVATIIADLQTLGLLG